MGRVKNFTPGKTPKKARKKSTTISRKKIESSSDSEKDTKNINNTVKEHEKKDTKKETKKDTKKKEPKKKVETDKKKNITKKKELQKEISLESDSSQRIKTPKNLGGKITKTKQEATPINLNRIKKQTTNIDNFNLQHLEGDLVKSIQKENDMLRELQSQLHIYEQYLGVKIEKTENNTIWKVERKGIKGSKVVEIECEDQSKVFVISLISTENCEIPRCLQGGPIEVPKNKFIFVFYNILHSICG